MAQVRVGPSFVLVVLLMTFRVSAHGDHGEDSNEKQDDDSKEFHKKSAIKRSHLLAHMADRMDLDGEGLRHIKKHLIEMTGGADLQDYIDIQKGDNNKGIFYFFKLHDYDNNQKLDGLELMSALTDFHEDDSGPEEKAGGNNFLDHEAEAIVDEMLEKHDKNKDGMLQFSELMDTTISSLVNDLDNPPQGDASENDKNEKEPEQKQESQ
ncbi:protein phosphatase 2B regulatory subunit cnb-1 [Nematostella vectensis]|uniref:protein phosphatase 2B regulatory subunit cnb-1 n=1 Tax=Nematostella vectensis TaxID=45351 RepID=UPI0020777BFB|nr:protein phosphatase 2B regulatory subunit cnb-1 [Nematostella vectensis]